MHKARKAQSICRVVCSVLSIGTCACAARIPASTAPVSGYVEEPVPTRPHNYATVILAGKLTVSSAGGHLTLEGKDVLATKFNISCSGDGARLQKNEKIIAISLTCSTARSGRAFLTLDVDDEASGFGSFRLSDGSGGQLEFGAKRLLAAGTLAGTPTE